MTHPATERLLAELSSTVTLVDVGARWGAVSVWHEFGDKGRLICFEADAEECDRLNSLSEQNTLYVPVALADHDRGVTVIITDGIGCSSIYPPKRVLYEQYPGCGIMRPVRTIACPSITLDKYCGQNNIANVDAIKLDTQGSELDILRGATEILKTVSLIDIEVEFNELYDGQPLFCDVDRFLRDHGFVLWRMSNLAHYSNGLVESSNSGILIASDPGSFQTIEQDNGQLFWAQAHYVRREFAPTEPDAELDRERALKAAILVGQYGHWDLSLEILRRSGDPKLLDVLASVIKPCGPQVPLRDQLTAAHAEIAELRRQNAELRASQVISPNDAAQLVHQHATDNRELLNLIRQMAEDARHTHNLQHGIIHTLQYGVIQEIRNIILDKQYKALGSDRILEFTYDEIPIKLFLPIGVFDLIEQSIIQNKAFFHYTSLEMTRQLIPMRDDIILDIGAYIGNHTVYYSKICGASQVHCFEPIPSSFRALTKNVQINDIDAVLYNCGLGSAHRRARSNINFQNVGGSHLIPDDEGSIAIKPLDSFDLPRFTFMKIDVEGMADQVLLGARETILRHKPRIVVEAFQHEVARVNSILEGLGYAKQAQLDDDFVYFPRAG